MTGRTRRRAARAALCAGLGALALHAAPVGRVHAASPAATGALDVHFLGLRSARGMLRACLTRDPAYYPKCERDPAALKASGDASGEARLAFADVPPGDYAVLVLHDENGNARVDTLFGIPREGVGFSRNPVIRFGAPRFEAVRIHVPAGASQTDVRIRYFL